MELEEHVKQIIAMSMAGIDQPLWETRQKVEAYIIANIILPERERNSALVEGIRNVVAEWKKWADSHNDAFNQAVRVTILLAAKQVEDIVLKPLALVPPDPQKEKK